MGIGSGGLKICSGRRAGGIGFVALQLGGALDCGQCPVRRSALADVDEPPLARQLIEHVER